MISGAQRKIIERKVRDMAEQFGDVGPRFHVHLLDIEDDNFEDKMAEFHKMSEELHDALWSAPENSVFFFSRSQNQTQRLSFSEICQVDIQSSLEKKGSGAELPGRPNFRQQDIQH